MKLKYGEAEVGQRVIARRPGAWLSGEVRVSRPRYVTVALPLAGSDTLVDFDLWKSDGWTLETVGVLS